MPTNAYNVRGINSRTGNINNNNASNSYGVAPDCENNARFQVVERPKQRSSHKERPSYL
nr:MAG TPA: hypothetical protein [Bacteriophage sp.]